MLSLSTFNIIGLPRNLQVLELEYGDDHAELTASMLTTIFKFNFLEQLSLKNTSLSPEDIPSNFQSNNLRRFTFTSQSKFDIRVILRPIIFATQHLQILSLETQADVGTDQLRLALANGNALTDFQLYGKRATYNFSDLIEVTRPQQRLKRINISYPCPESMPEQISFHYSHELSSLLPQLKEVVLRLPSSDRIDAALRGMDLHSIKLNSLVPEGCLELCTIIVGDLSLFVDLYILLPQIRRYPSHR
jgi:hypothetical protein